MHTLVKLDWHNGSITPYEERSAPLLARTMVEHCVFTITVLSCGYKTFKTVKLYCRPHFSTYSSNYEFLL